MERLPSEEDAYDNDNQPARNLYTGLTDGCQLSQ